MSYYYYKFIRFLNDGVIPFTKSILILSGLSFILSLLLGGLNILSVNGLLALIPANLPGCFWTFLTYPLVNSDFITLILSGLWLWFVGGSLERTWGSKMYGFFFILVTLVTGGAMALAAIITKMTGYSVIGLWLPLVGITWAWAVVYPEREVMFWGVFPVKAFWMAWIDAGITFFSYLPVHLFFALASISGIILVYLFGDTGRLGRGLRYRSPRREKRYPKARRNRLRRIK